MNCSSDRLVGQVKRERLIELLKRKGVECVEHSHLELRPVKQFLEHEDVTEYLKYCLPRESYQASGVHVSDLGCIYQDIEEEVDPGGYISMYGFVVVGSSVGGNVFSLDAHKGGVYWVDHGTFCDDLITYEDRATGEWHDVPFSKENIYKSMVLLNEDLFKFFEDLVEEKLTDYLFSLN